MEIIKKDNAYYYLSPVEEGFDIDREIGKVQDDIHTLEIKLKQLLRTKERD